GREVTPVQRDGDRLTLGRAARDEPQADSLQLRVYRRLVDGVPALLTTRIEIGASGQAREEVIGPVLPDGFAPLSLASEWPARLDADGRLRVLDAPGPNRVTPDARATGRLPGLVAGVPADPWARHDVRGHGAAAALRE